MAGDWIQITVDLPTKPEVAIIAKLCAIPPDEVVGKLIRFWGWCQRHTADGTLPGLDIATIATSTNLPESFLEALTQVKWLEITDAGAIIPKWDTYMSQSAKRRLQARQTMQRRRQQIAPAPTTAADHPHTPPTDDAATQPSVARQRNTRCGPAQHTRNQRREEKSIDIISPPLSPPPSHGGETDIAAMIPPEYNTPEIHAAVTEWLAYRRTIKHPYRHPIKQIPLLITRYGARFPEAVTYSIAMGYQGCFLPTNGPPEPAGAGPGQRHATDASW